MSDGYRARYVSQAAIAILNGMSRREHVFLDEDSVKKALRLAEELYSQLRARYPNAAFDEPVIVETGVR